MSGVVLIRNMLGLKRSGRVVNSRKDLASVEKAVEMLWSLRYECVVSLSPYGAVYYSTLDD